ncbi:helix-turn-helix domain-containing protein [Flavobacterium sp. FlaQc-28]|uniref:helix-turn-helix domain-containing protein n=1 Tax=Flavobacterium sp. FlaQc-28 TaxID=3374178 RepID=UPI0037568162
MSTKTLGEKLRELRESNNLPLRKISAIVDVDVAILSKMERGERPLTKNIIMQLAEIYQYNSEELLILFLCEKILLEIKDEDLGEKALNIANKRVKILKRNQYNGD